MKHPRLSRRNRDLKIYVLRRVLLQLLGYGAWLAVFWFGAMSYNDAHQTYPPHRRMVGWRLAVLMLAAAVTGFFLFRLWRLISLRRMEGTVIDARLSRGYTASSDPGAGNPVDYDFRLYTYLVIQTPKGKQRRLRFEQKPGFYLYYYPGTYVCRLFGFSYPIRDPARSAAPEKKEGRIGQDPHDDLSAGHLCIACGYLNNRSAEEPCGRCGHSLVDAEAFRNDDPDAETRGKDTV